MKESGLHLSFLPPSYGPYKSSSALQLTGILFKDNLTLVHQYSIHCVPVTCRHGHYQTPMAQLSSHFPHMAQTVGGRHIFQYGRALFSPKALFHSHAETICKFAITSLNISLAEPWLHRHERGITRYWIKCLNVCVFFSFIYLLFYSNFWFKPAITSNSTVQEMSVMVKAVV